MKELPHQKRCLWCLLGDVWCMMFKNRRPLHTQSSLVKSRLQPLPATISAYLYQLLRNSICFHARKMSEIAYTEFWQRKTPVTSQNNPKENTQQKVRFNQRVHSSHSHGRVTKPYLGASNASFLLHLKVQVQIFQVARTVRSICTTSGFSNGHETWETVPSISAPKQTKKALSKTI